MTEHPGKHAPSDAVIRLADVKMAEAALAAALNTELDRYETSHNGSMYAQIYISTANDIWKALADFVVEKGPAVLSLQEAGLIGAARVDLPVMFHDDLMALTVTVPSAAAALLGRYRIDIEFSVYQTSGEA